MICHMVHVPLTSMHVTYHIHQIRAIRLDFESHDDSRVSLPSFVSIMQKHLSSTQLEGQQGMVCSYHHVTMATRRCVHADVSFVWECCLLLLLLYHACCRHVCDGVAALIHVPCSVAVFDAASVYIWCCC